VRTRFIIALCACAALATVFMTATSSARPRTHSSTRLTARYAVFPLRGVSRSALQRMSDASTTVPIWTGHTGAFGSAYTYQMVGKDPFVTLASPSTSVPVDIIPVKITIGSDTFDPTTPNACTGANSVDTLVQQSPLFRTRTYIFGGTNIGNVQYIDGFQRSNFWSQTGGGANPGYHVTFSPVVLHSAISVTVPAADSGILVSSGCQPLGEMDSSWWQNYIQTVLLPTHPNLTNPTRLPVIVLDNVVEYSGSLCCIIGFHGAYTASGGGIQTYAQSDYESTGDFGAGLQDVAAISHEIGEWMDDPFGGNPTPAWGHIGQVSGCQGNLEVGDPLSGTEITAKMPNGITYHPQELAFWAWYYRRPANGINHWFSLNGTFRKNAGPVCT
jgi:hypothetical protein